VLHFSGLLRRFANSNRQQLVEIFEQREKNRIHPLNRSNQNDKQQKAGKSAGNSSLRVEACHDGGRHYDRSKTRIAGTRNLCLELRRYYWIALIKDCHNFQSSIAHWQFVPVRPNRLPAA